MYFSSISSRLLLYDVNSWDLKKTHWCYEGILRDISWSDDGKYLLQVNAKGVLEILNPFDYDVKTLQHIPLKDTWSASFHREGHRHIAIGTKSGNVMIWDTKTKNLIKTFPTPLQQFSVDFISYNAKNTSLAATMHNGDTIIYGLVSNIPVLTIKLACSRSISAMKFHHESRSLIGLATDEGHVVVRDITTNKDKVFFENVHASPVSDIAYSQVNRDVMLSTGFDKVMQVYDLRLQNVVSSVKMANTLTCIAMNVENQVALGSKNGTVLIYDLRDLTTSLSTLEHHTEEVRRVAFQPPKDKVASADVSLREEKKANLSPYRVSSPVRNRTSDMFFIMDSPPKTNIDSAQSGDAKADSFLVMMGLDKSTENCEEDLNNKSVEFQQRKSERLDLRLRRLESEKNISKVSTPLNSRTSENLGFPSPSITNGIPDDGRRLNAELSNLKPSNSVTALEDKKFADDIKDFIKLSLADVADDNRNYFLHIMMALTKQKLYLEKQLSDMKAELFNMAAKQNALVETNRKLVLEIDQLKARNISNPLN